MFTLTQLTIINKLTAKIFFNNAENDTHVIRASVDVDTTTIDATRVNIATTLKGAFTDGRAPLNSQIRNTISKTSKHTAVLNDIEAQFGPADYVINYGTREFIAFFQSHDRAVLVIPQHGKKPTLIWARPSYRPTKNGSDALTLTFKIVDANNEIAETREILSPAEAYNKAMQALNKLRNDMNGDDRNFIRAMEDMIAKCKKSTAIETIECNDDFSIEAFEETVEVQEVAEVVEVQEVVEQIEAIEPVVINKFKPTINDEGIYVCDGVDYTEVEFDYEERQRVREGARMVINVDIINEFINNRQQFACQAVIIATRLLHSEGGYIAPDYARNKIKSIREELIKQANNHPITGRS